jgi:hypothetical protein
MFAEGAEEMKLSSRSNPDMPARLSALWIFLLFNMVFADIFSFMYPGFLGQIATGVVDGTTITPLFLLVAAVVTEISIVMVVLSRVLKPSVNRWVNMVAAVVTIAWVIGGGSFTPHYIFFASIEVATSLLIIGLAWNWRSVAESRFATVPQAS